MKDRLSDKLKIPEYAALFAIAGLLLEPRSPAAILARKQLRRQFSKLSKKDEAALENMLGLEVWEDDMIAIFLRLMLLKLDTIGELDVR